MVLSKQNKITVINSIVLIDSYAFELTLKKTKARKKTILYNIWNELENIKLATECNKSG